MRSNVTAQISSIVSRLKVNEPLKAHTTFRIGGPAKYFAEACSREEIVRLWDLSRRENIPLAVLGSGSNVLVSDEGFDGMVVRLMGDFAKHSFEGEKLHAGAGAVCANMLRCAADKELSGLEILSGIPGTIGGALVGNAGSANRWIGELVEQVETVNSSGRIETFAGQDLEFSYRRSNLKGCIVLSAVICLKKSSKIDILSKVKELSQKRIAAQPAGVLCAGSVFKNPPNDSAGRLIEQAGLKGLRFGGAMISNKHANFIINESDATSMEVRALIGIARQKVKEMFGVELELEIKLIGDK